MIKRIVEQKGLSSNHLVKRSYCMVLEHHSLRIELIERVSLLHSRYAKDFFEPISSEGCEEMKEEIFLGTYKLNPVDVIYVKRDELEDLILQSRDLSSLYTRLIRFYDHQDPDYLTIAKVLTYKDVLFILALEQVLLENTVQWECPSIDNLIYDYHSYINKELVSVNRIYRIEIDFPSPIGSFLMNLTQKNIKTDPCLYDFLTSILNMPYIDKDGLCDESKNGTYTVGDLSRIVQNLVFTEIFDSEFRKEYPGLAFTRFVNQVIIGIKDSDEVVFNEEAGYALLKSLGMTGQIVSIGHGDPPISCYGMDVNIEKTL